MLRGKWLLLCLLLALLMMGCAGEGFLPPTRVPEAALWMWAV